MQRVWSSYYDDNPGLSSQPVSIASSPSPQQLDIAPNDPYSQINHSIQTPLSSSNLLTPGNDLLPPRPPFAHPLSRTQSAPKSLKSLSDTASLRPPSSFIPHGTEIDKDVSLSINYFPLKFSSPRNTGIYKRKRKEVDEAFDLDILGLPKRGGGRGAFKPGEARMAGEGDEGEDADDAESPDNATSGRRSRFSGRAGVSHLRGKLRWNRFKWCLFIANMLLTAYALAALVACLLTWFNIFPMADVVRVANRPELILSTIAASVAVLTSLMGWSGILLNSRPFLAIYTLLLWITFMFLITPGYMTYKRREFNLEGKLNAQWSQQIGTVGRLRIQNQLSCCGYFSPFVEATVSQSCYSRSILPGCKGPFLRFQRMILEHWYEAAFALVPVHLAIFVVALLCSNHITYRFGKGMMPKAYRLEWKSVAMILDSYASQLADIYGEDAVRETRKKFDGDLTTQLDGSVVSTPATDTLPKVLYDVTPSPTAIAVPSYGGGSAYSSAHMYTGNGMTQRKHAPMHHEPSQEWDFSDNADPLYTSTSAQGSDDALIHAAGKSNRAAESGLAGPSDPPTYRQKF